MMELEEKIEVEKVYPTPLQKELYEIQIKDIGNRIDRLDDRNYDLLDISEEIDRDIGSTDIKTSDEIAGINRQLFAELSKIDNHKSEIASIEEQRIENKEKHESRVDELNEKYEVTFRTLISKIKTLNAKVNALEDYKNKRDNLREKLKARDEFLIRKEAEVEQKLQKIKIQYKIDRAALLDDLQNQIFQRGIDYEAENSRKTSPVTRCLFNNNIFLKNEINMMYQEIVHEGEVCAEKDRTRSFNWAWARSSHSEMMKALEALRFQKVLGKHLNKHCEKPQIDTDDTSTFDREQPNTDFLIGVLKSEVLMREQNLAKVQTSLHQKNVTLYSAKNQRKQSSRKIDSLVATLYDLKYAIGCALELPIIHDFGMGSSTQNFAKMSKNEFSSYLLSLVKRE